MEGEVECRVTARAGPNAGVRSGRPASAACRASGARLLLLGGAPIDGPRGTILELRLLRRERIEQAKADWKAERFAKVPGDEKELIPLPEERLSVPAQEDSALARGHRPAKAEPPRGFADALRNRSGEYRDKMQAETLGAQQAGGVTFAVGHPEHLRSPLVSLLRSS